MYYETHRRSLLKALSYRVWGTAFSILTVYYFTGQFDIAVAFGGVEVLGKLVLNYVHERAWSHIGFGRVIQGRGALSEPDANRLAG